MTHSGRSGNDNALAVSASMFKLQLQTGNDTPSLSIYDHIPVTYQHARRLVHGITPDRVGAHDTNTTEHHSAANNANTTFTLSTVDDAPNVTTDTTLLTPPGANVTIVQDEHSTLTLNSNAPALCTIHSLPRHCINIFQPQLKLKSRPRRCNAQTPSPLDSRWGGMVRGRDVGDRTERDESSRYDRIITRSPILSTPTRGLPSILQWWTGW